MPLGAPLDPPASTAEAPRSTALRLWQRLGVRLTVLFTVVTLLTVGLAGTLVYQRQKREVEETLDTQLPRSSGPSRFRDLLPRP